MSTLFEAPSNDERWVSFCASRPDKSLFQSPSWANVIERTYGFSTRVLMIEEGGRFVAGMPFAHIEDFRGPRRVAFAFSDNLEPLPSERWPEFEAWIAKDSVPWNVRGLCAPSELAASSREAALHHIIELPSTFDEAAKRFHYKHVQNIKQAERAGLTYSKVDTLEGVERFYELHAQVRKNKHKLLPQGFSFFKAIYEEFFPGQGFVLVAEHEARDVSAMFFLVCGSTLYYKFSASALDALTLRPNHFLITKAIEVALSLGLSRVDLGISDAEGLIRFKERIGGAGRPVYAAAYNPREKSAAVKQVEQTLGELTGLLTIEEAPLEMAKRGGELLYKFFT